MTSPADIDAFISEWRGTGGSGLANTQSFISGLARLLGVDPPRGARADDTANDYVFERRVFQDNGDGTESFGRIDCYKRGCFILEAKQGSEADWAAADKGEDDLDIFGQTAKTRVARGTARRGTPGWAKAMVQARGQAERYAKALPIDHGWPPFLLVADIGYCIEVYADFTGTGKAYAQFPDRARYRIMLEDLRDEDVRDRLRAIWTDPKSLDPTARAARVTRDIADLLATVARRLEKRGYDAETTSGFLMRVLFTMFAEDSKLIPEGSFTQLLKNQRAHPEHLEHQLSALWAAMDSRPQFRKDDPLAGSNLGLAEAKVPGSSHYLLSPMWDIVHYRDVPAEQIAQWNSRLTEAKVWISSQSDESEIAVCAEHELDLSFHHLEAIISLLHEARSSGDCASTKEIIRVFALLRPAFLKSAFATGLEHTLLPLVSDWVGETVTDAAELRDRCKREGWTIVHEYWDERKRGSAGLGKEARPGMHALLDRISKGDIDQILVEATDRLARHSGDSGQIREIADSHGTVISTLSGGPVGDLEFYLKGWIDADFSKQLGAKVTRGQKGAVRDGRAPAGVPYGYRNCHRAGDDGRIRLGVREIIEEQAQILRRIYQEYADGMSPNQIARRLNKENVEGPRNGVWKANSISGDHKRKNGILQNRMYIGDLIYGRSRKVRDPKTRKTLIKPVPEEEWTICHSEHWRIIPQPLWDAVQARRELYSGRSFSRQQRPKRLLSGLAVCGCCGSQWIVVGKERWGCSSNRKAEAVSTRGQLRRPNSKPGF